jgi:tetratricopeptide (TPR) repeat protein
MAGEIFLARTEEQDKFKQVLRSHHKTLRQILQTPVFPRPKPTENELPFVMLFYGEGGMGKTRLIRRLQQIVQEEPTFADKFNHLFLDWEEQQKLNLNLQVGHDNIAPEALLAVLHGAFDHHDKSWGNYFDEYRKLLKKLKEAEAKVDEELKKAKPDAELQTQVRKWGAKGIAWIIRQAPGADVVPSQALESVLETGIQVGAEGLYQARQFVQAALTPEEYEIYAQPHERLAEALGKGIAQLAKRKPLLIFLDTYEIVDRPDCDYTLRRAIQHSSDRVIWIIAGRANLADSGQRGKIYFRGYKRDFPEERIYTKSLSEFGDKEIHSYFSQLVRDRSLTDEEVEAVARFSLGIPFVIAQAAAMWQEGKPLAEIVAPVQSVLGETTPRRQVVKETSERFLMHCFSAKERERDLRAIYALAMMRRPDAKLLKEMLDVADLEPELQSLRERYSFIWVEQIRLDEKLAQFLREYLLDPVRRDSSMVQQLNERAIAWLELQLEALTRDISDTAEQLRDERITETTIDLTHHHFWQGEEAGWRYLVPQAIAGSQYNRDFTRSLLEVAEAFSATFSKEEQRRLKLFSKSVESFPDPEDFRQTLEELEKLAQRKWLDGKGEEERKAILRLEKGRLLYRQGKYKDALQVYLEVEKQIPETARQLRKNLAEEFYSLSNEFIWPNRSSNAVYSADGQKAIEKAIDLNCEEARYHYNLGVIHAKARDYSQAIAAWQSAIELYPRYAAPHNGLGYVYKDQNKLDEAIAAYQRAIQLDPKDASSHNGLGIVYSDQGKLDEPIAAYQRAIELDPKGALAYSNLGWAYLLKADLTQAKDKFEEAINLDPKEYSYVLNLGVAYALQGNIDEARIHWQKGLALCQASDAWDRAIHALYTVAIGETERGMTEMQKVLDEEGSAVAALRNALGDAEILARCPVKPEGIDTVIEMLKRAIA